MVKECGRQKPQLAGGQQRLLPPVTKWGVLMVCLNRAINAVAGERNSSVSAVLPVPALQKGNHFELVEKPPHSCTSLSEKLQLIKR